MSPQLEFFATDNENEEPKGLFIRHDHIGTPEYDDDHAVFVMFDENLLGRQVVTIQLKEPLTVKEEIECFCGAKFTIVNGEVEQVA